MVAMLITKIFDSIRLFILLGVSSRVSFVLE